ncbi:MAG: hypothetical protein ACREVL_14265, partial [Solimonas sp.]
MRDIGVVERFLICTPLALLSFLLFELGVYRMAIGSWDMDLIWLKLAGGVGSLLVYVIAVFVFLAICAAVFTRQPVRSMLRTSFFLALVAVCAILMLVNTFYAVKSMSAGGETSGISLCAVGLIGFYQGVKLYFEKEPEAPPRPA